MGFDWSGKTRWLAKRMDEEEYARNNKKRLVTYRGKKKKKKIKWQKEASQLRNKLVQEATPEELIVKDFLDSRNVNYSFQKIIYTSSSYYIADFFFPHNRIVLEIDGYYHFTPEGKKRDKHRTEVLGSMGYRVRRITNEEVTTRYMDVYDKLVMWNIVK